MIVTAVDTGSRTIGTESGEVRVRCLARRGMLHSECEAVDHVRIPPYGGLDLVNRGGVEGVWIALRGGGEVVGVGPLSPGAVVLAPDDGQVAIRAAADGIELLWLRVLPEAVSRRLPNRRPEV